MKIKREKWQNNYNRAEVKIFEDCARILFMLFINLNALLSRAMEILYENDKHPKSSNMIEWK